MCNIMHFCTVSTSQLKHFQWKVIRCSPVSTECQRQCDISTAPVLGVVIARAVFSRCRTVHIFKSQIFSEAESDHNRGSRAVQLSSVLLFLMWLVLNSKKRGNLQVKTGRLVGDAVDPTECPDPTFIPLRWSLRGVCLCRSPQLILICFYFISPLIILFLQHFLLYAALF